MAKRHQKLLEFIKLTKNHAKLLNPSLKLTPKQWNTKKQGVKIHKIHNLKLKHLLQQLENHL